MSSTQQLRLAVLDSEQEQQKRSEETHRPPLVPPEKSNEVSRKPRTREITSRYKSPIASRRSPSPSLSRTVPASTPSLIRRAQSVERPRPSTPSSPSRPSTPPNNSTVRRRPSTPSSPSRPSTPTNNSVPSNGLAEMQISSKFSLGRSQEGLWPSTRSLPVSFQTDTFSLPVTKREKPVNTLKPSANVGVKQPENQAPQRKVTTPERKRTPLRGKNADQLENSKPLENLKSRAVDRQIWPSRSSGKTPGNALKRSVDLTDKATKAATQLLQGGGVSAPTRTPTPDALTRGLRRSAEGPVGPACSNVARRVSFDGREVPDMGIIDGTSLRASRQGNDSNFTADRPSRIPVLSRDSELDNTEDTPWGDLISREEIESFYSHFTGGGSSRWRSVSGLNFGHRSVLRSSMPESELPSSGALVLPRPPKVVSSSTGVSSSSSSERASSTPRSSRSQSSPLRGLHRPPSPSKSVASSTSSRGISPSRPRWASAPSASSVTNNTGNSSSVLNFVADVRKGKKGANYIEEAHQLRILYNRYLQWRFINAQANASLSIQQVKVERLLYGVWSTTSKLRDSVSVKRVELQQLRQTIKINSILKEQVPYLNDWALLEREHSDSLFGTIESLEASTLRLPVTGGARADIQTLRDAISSAVDVMQAMGSSICILLSKMEGVNVLVSELAKVATQEKSLLDECGDILAATAALQVEESSLRTHLIQFKQDVRKSCRT